MNVDKLHENPAEQKKQPELFSGQISDLSVSWKAISCEAHKITVSKID